MKQRLTPWVALAVLVSSILPLKPAPPEDVVWLRTGERLRGQILGMAGEGWLRWQHPHIAEEIKLALTNVLKIRFAPRNLGNTNLENPCVVRLINGDNLSGNLAGFDGMHLSLESPACGRLQIPRQIMVGLQPMEMNARIVYEGPTGLDGWTQGQGVAEVAADAWVYGNGAFIANKPGSIARDVKLPDLVEISFQVEWEGYTTLAIALYADRLQPIQLLAKDKIEDLQGFYSLQISMASFISAVLVPIKKDVPLNPQGLGMAINQNFIQSSKAAFTIRANKKERIVILYCNGQLMRQWQDPVETLGSGTILRFVNQQATTVRISNLVIKHWDGRHEFQNNLTTQGTNDLLLLVNQDRVSGVLGPLRNKEWEVGTPLGPVQVPLSKIEQLHFSILKRQPPPTKPAPARLTFNNQDRLSIQLDHWSGDRLQATHPLLGQMIINISALREIVLD